MDHKQVGQFWDENADTWTQLARMGCDLYRDHINTPAFLAMLSDVNGLSGLDIGCGEGYNTRMVAQRGAKMTAIDISPKFIANAQEYEQREPLGIKYDRASAVELPFDDDSFDFAIATMSLMDIAETEKAIAEAYRIIKQGGFFQFSITHPCFWTSSWEWIRDESGKRTALKCGDYFAEQNGDIERWIFGATPAELKAKLLPFKIPRFTRPLSKWLNMLIKTGFILEQFDEPRADKQTLQQHPELADTNIVAYFLIIRCRKA